MACGTSWFPTSVRASRTRRSRAGVSRSATRSSSTRRCARWRPTRPRWRSPARMRAGSSNSVAPKARRCPSAARAGAHRDGCSRARCRRTAAAPARKPVLVGYGADDDDGHQQASAGRGRHTTPRQAPGAQAGRRLARRPGRAAPVPGRTASITREDVLAAAGTVGAQTPDTVAVRGVQAEMAQRMTLSRSEIPDAHASVQVDCSACCGCATGCVSGRRRGRRSRRSC